MGHCLHLADYVSSVLFPWHIRVWIVEVPYQKEALDGATDNFYLTANNIPPYFSRSDGKVSDPSCLTFAFCGHVPDVSQRLWHNFDTTSWPLHMSSLVLQPIGISMFEPSFDWLKAFRATDSSNYATSNKASWNFFKYKDVDFSSWWVMLSRWKFDFFLSLGCYKVTQKFGFQLGERTDTSCQEWSIPC